MTLQNPVVATPPFHPDVVKSVVVKIIDLCPLSSVGWCSGTSKKPNSYAILSSYREIFFAVAQSSLYHLYSAGAYLNFDLAYPSKAIPDDFFPSNVSLYGYKVVAFQFDTTTSLTQLHGL